MILTLCCRNALARCKAQVLPLLFLCIPAFSSLPPAASIRTQLLSISVKEAPLEKVFADITRQTGYDFWFEPEVLKTSRKVTLELKNVSLETALEKCFEQQALTYKIVDKTIVVTARPASAAPKKAPPVKGKVTDMKGTPLVGVSVRVKGTNTGTVTDKDGNYSIEADPAGVLVFSYIGYQTFEIKINGQTEVSLSLVDSNTKLDEVQVIGYGTTTRRYNTGNVSTVKGDVIAQQPVTNPLQALAGRVAGLQVTQSSGVAGAPVKVQIRGQSSLTASNNPLYIVDGVPFTSMPTERLAGVNVAPTGNNNTPEFGNPLNTINPADIESIEVLKDADATSIYGSRAANGVILITTKSGMAGKPMVSVDVKTGAGIVTRYPDLLNTAQFLQMRKDALANSGITPTPGNAPELLEWDPNANFDWQRWYIGNTSRQTDASLSLTGGNNLTTFLLRGNYHHETAILAGESKYRRGGFHGNITTNAFNNKLKVSTTFFYNSDYNYLSGGQNYGAFYKDVIRGIPNFPVHDSAGRYYFPPAKFNYVAKSTAFAIKQSDNLNGNINFTISILPGLNFRTSAGFNRILTTERNGNPSTSLAPFEAAIYGGANAAFANTTLKTILAEPQLDYTTELAGGNLHLLAGSTLQENQLKSQTVSVNGYSNDLLLGSMNFGTVSSKGSNTTEYKYVSLFGRFTYNLDNRYILNGTIRRDGSTRFGPDKQFGTFGSVGVAWLFSNEPFAKTGLTFLSFGKLRASWGTTGNDGIGDYNFLSLYTSSTDYGTTNTLVPNQIGNPTFQWEITKKLEVALELGFFSDRLLANIAWYRNRSGNQLVNYPLPSITGFDFYMANLPAVVQNTGIEIEMNGNILKGQHFRWDASLNLSVPRNKLISFPDLAKTSYAYLYVIGEPLSNVQRLRYLGADPQTGRTMVEDIDKNGVITNNSSYNEQGGDFVIVGQTAPEWLGGFTSSLHYRNWGLDFALQYVRQQGNNLYHYGNLFGTAMNTWSSFLNYWRKPGDVNVIPKPFSGGSTSPIEFQNSDIGFSDASFFRLKNVALSFTLPESLTRKIRLTPVKIYVQGQNLLTITRYEGYDPETAIFPSLMLPPLRQFVAGLTFSFK